MTGDHGYPANDIGAWIHISGGVCVFPLKPFKCSLKSCTFITRTAFTIISQALEHCM